MLVPESACCYWLQEFLCYAALTGYQLANIYISNNFLQFYVWHCLTFLLISLYVCYVTLSQHVYRQNFYGNWLKNGRICRKHDTNTETEQNSWICKVVRFHWRWVYIPKLLLLYVWHVLCIWVQCPLKYIFEMSVSACKLNMNKNVEVLRCWHAHSP